MCTFTLFLKTKSNKKLGVEKVAFIRHKSQFSGNNLYIMFFSKVHVNIFIINSSQDIFEHLAQNVIFSPLSSLSFSLELE